MEQFIGRNAELAEIGKALDSKKSEFIAIYGRRRVGKTLLVRAATEDKFSFYISGRYQRPKAEQLLNFSFELQRYSKSEDFQIFDSWIVAFHALSKMIEALPQGKKVIFIDELPWLDTPRSGFASALDGFWNSWAVFRDDIKLIVCGSATSWMIDNVIHEVGGLHNRLTNWMEIKPLNLVQTEEFLREKGFRYSKKEIVECYMVMGGIPHYLSLLDKGLSVPQNIDRLFFSEDANLEKEFDKTFMAQYRKPANHRKIIAAIAAKKKGITRNEILCATKLTNNGEFTKILEEIEECGFVRSYRPYGTLHNSKMRQDTLFQIVDPFSLFYYGHMVGNNSGDENYWSTHRNLPSCNAWAGLAFETLCLNHIRQIKKALGISMVATNIYSWASTGKAQIDLVIDCQDGIINVCEMKYSKDLYTLTEKESDAIARRVETFISETNTKKSVNVTLVTTYGLAEGIHASEIQNVITLDDLFAEL